MDHMAKLLGRGIAKPEKPTEAANFVVSDLTNLWNATAIAFVTRRGRKQRSHLPSAASAERYTLKSSCDFTTDDWNGLSLDQRWKAVVK